MTGLRRVSADERGLIGKIMVLWLVLGVLLVILAYDGVQIAITRFRVADAAQTAAFESATTLRTTQGDRQAAYQAALDAVAEADPDLRLVEFVIDQQATEVEVTVSDKAPTLLVGRVGFLRSLAKAKTTESSDVASP